jgi:hypothetical protein
MVDAGETGPFRSWWRASFGHNLRRKALAIGSALPAPGATRGHPLDQHRERQIAAVADDQPWDGGFGPFPYWAVPVLPKTPGREADPEGLPGAPG